MDEADFIEGQWPGHTEGRMSDHSLHLLVVFKECVSVLHYFYILYNALSVTRGHGRNMSTDNETYVCMT